MRIKIFHRGTDRFPILAGTLCVVGVIGTAVVPVHPILAQEIPLTNEGADLVSKPGNRHCFVNGVLTYRRAALENLQVPRNVTTQKISSFGSEACYWVEQGTVLTAPPQEPVPPQPAPQIASNTAPQQPPPATAPNLNPAPNLQAAAQIPSVPVRQGPSLQSPSVPVVSTAPVGTSSSGEASTFAAAVPVVGTQTRVDRQGPMGLEGRVKPEGNQAAAFPAEPTTGPTTAGPGAQTRASLGPSLVPNPQGRAPADASDLPPTAPVQLTPPAGEAPEEPRFGALSPEPIETPPPARLDVPVISSTPGAAPAAARPTPPPAAPAVGNGIYWAQLASFSSGGNPQAEWQSRLAGNGILASYQPTFEESLVFGEEVVRIRVGPMNFTQADELCAAITGDCFVVKDRDAALRAASGSGASSSGSQGPVSPVTPVSQRGSPIPTVAAESPRPTSPPPVSNPPALRQPATIAQQPAQPTNASLAVAPSSGSQSYWAQLASRPDQASATAVWQSLLAQNPALRGLEPSYVSGQVGGQRVVRLRIGPLPLSLASDLCNNISGDCLVVRASSTPQ